MSVADIIAKCQTGEAISSDEYAALHAAVDSAETPVNVRVRALPFVAAPAELTAALLKKLYATLVHLLEDDLPAVHHAVIQAIATLGETAVKIMDAAKSTEVVRDLSDILLQISVEGSGFTLDLRKEAKEAVLTRLAVASVMGVTSKALHLLSNDRWTDTNEQLEAERKVGLDLFHTLATHDRYKELWTEELEAKVTKFIGAVYPALSASEMGRLLSASAKIPTILAKQGAPVVDTVLKLKLDTPRGIETLAKLYLVLPKDAVNDSIADKVLAIVGKASGNDAFSVQAARALVLAAEHSSAEKAAKIITAARALLAKDNGFSVTFTEAVLRALSIALTKAPEAAAELFADAAFLAQVTAKAEAASKAELSFLFATKKAAEKKEATPRHAEAIEALKNIARIGAFLSEKKTPTLDAPSWLARKQLPKVPVKRELDLDAPIQGKKKQPAPARK